jgi:hypothetical protein
MTERDLRKIADDADVIISGYAIMKCEEGLRVFNLNNAVGTAVFQKDGMMAYNMCTEVILLHRKCIEYLGWS